MKKKMTRIILNTPWITDPRLNPIEIYIGKDRHRKKIYDRKNIETKKTLKTEWCRGEEDYFHVIEMLQEIYSIGGSAFVKGDSNGDLIWLYQGYSVQYLKAFVYLLESTGR